MYLFANLWMLDLDDFKLPGVLSVFCSTFYYLLFVFRILGTSYLTVPRRVLCPLQCSLILVTRRIKELFQCTQQD